MSVSVNPPPQLRIPEQFFNDPITRSFFEQQRTILFQLWQRTGGSLDAVAGKQIVIIAGSDLILDSAGYGSLIIVEADTADVTVTLPPITSATIGESVDVVIIDATFTPTVVPSGLATIFGETSVIMNAKWMSIQYTAVSINVWVAT